MIARDIVKFLEKFPDLEVRVQTSRNGITQGKILMLFTGHDETKPQDDRLAEEIIIQADI